VSPSTTPIQPLILGTESAALTASHRLAEAGYRVTAIRPPTVPVGTARLRITLSAAHTAQQVEGLLAALEAALA
jgi:8-amino-7-oxononanoate synthase